MNTPENTVLEIFIGTDERNWDQVQNAFAPSVLLDYSSMTGQAAVTLSPAEIITAWKSVLPGFDHTHHQIGNFQTEENGSKAHTFCYGVALHFLPDKNGPVWTVVGTYDFELIRTDVQWKVSAMVFHFKFQDGNSELPKQAAERIKQKG